MLFERFVNTDQTDTEVEFVGERGQSRPADWPRDGVVLDQVKLPAGTTPGQSKRGKPEPAPQAVVGGDELRRLPGAEIGECRVGLPLAPAGPRRIRLRNAGVDRSRPVRIRRLERA